MVLAKCRSVLSGDWCQLDTTKKNEYKPLFALDNRRP